MDIVFLITDITGHGGTERTTSLLANKFTQVGHRVTILSLFQENNSCVYDVDNKIEVIYLVKNKYSSSFGFFKRLRLLLKAYNKMHRYFVSNKSHIVIGQGLLPNMYLWKLKGDKKAIACEHYKYDVYGHFIRCVRNCIYKSFNSVVVLTANDQIKFQKNGVDAIVIPNMISFSVRDNIGVDSKRMITVGRLHPQKGYDLLLPALKKVFFKFPDWRIDIFGDGPDLGLLENIRTKLGLQSNVFFKGFSSDIQSEYLRSSLYVMSSRYEGLPMTLLEALASGLPIVSFKCPEGPEDLLKNDVGYLVEPENVEKLSQAIITMISNKDMRLQYAARGMAAVEEYTPERVCEKWELLFRSICK